MVELELPTTHGTNWGKQKNLWIKCRAVTLLHQTLNCSAESADTDRAKNGAKLLANTSAFKKNATLSLHSSFFSP